MKVGISIKVDVTKIEKARLFKGAKGTYLDLVTFVDLDELDQYGNSGFISQSVSKEDKEAGIRSAILGNCKVFYKDQAQAGGFQQAAPKQAPPRQVPPADIDFDDIAF